MSTFERSCIFNRNIFHNMPNMLMKILPDCKEYEDIVKVCHTEGMHLKLYSEYGNGTRIRIIIFKGNKK